MKRKLTPSIFWLKILPESICPGRSWRDFCSTLASYLGILTGNIRPCKKGPTFWRKKTEKRLGFFSRKSWKKVEKFSRKNLEKTTKKSTLLNRSARLLYRTVKVLQNIRKMFPRHPQAKKSTLADDVSASCPAVHEKDTARMTAWP